MPIADDDLWVGRVREVDMGKVTLIAGHVSGGAEVHDPLIRRCWCWGHDVESVHEVSLVERR